MAYQGNNRDPYLAAWVAEKQGCQPGKEQLEKMAASLLQNAGSTKQSTDEQISEAEQPEANKLVAEPVAWIRMLNGEIDWSEDCLGQDAGQAISCYADDAGQGEIYTAAPLYINSDSNALDAERVDWLEATMKSDSVELGVSLYPGSKTLDGVVDKVVWVGALDSHHCDGACTLGDDFGEGRTLREAIDAAIAAMKEKEQP